MKLPSSSIARSLRLCAMALGAALAVSAAHAVPYALSSDGNTVVRITPQTTAPGLDTALITASYPGYTVNTTGLSGSFATTSYTAGWSGGAGGARLTGNYTQATPIPAGSQLNYIQVIRTNVPLGGSSSPYIDPRPNDDNLPFYWTRSEAAAQGGPRSVAFADFSKRDPASLATVNPVTWNAALYPVLHDGGTTVTVGSGIEWGWTMKAATAGKAKGTFDDPSPTCPPATCSGLGTGAISWGTGSPGSLAFTGAQFAPKVGEAFKVGTLSYTNGATTNNSALNGITLNIALEFDNVGELNFTFDAGLSINNTPNSSDPRASADFVKFLTPGFSNSFNVLEGASATADLMARLTPVFSIIPGIAGDKDPFTLPDELKVIGYELQLLAFANSTPGGFIPDAEIPLPGTLPLLLAGLVGALFVRHHGGVRTPSRG